MTLKRRLETAAAAIEQRMMIFRKFLVFLPVSPLRYVSYAPSDAIVSD